MFGKPCYGVFQSLEKRGPRSPVQNENAPDEQKTEPILELNFVPTWARQPPAANPYAHFEGRGEERRERRDRRDGGRPKFGGKGPPRRDRGERRPFHERRAYAPERRPEAAAPRPERLPLEISFIPESQRLGAVVREIRAAGRAYPVADVAARFLSNPAFYLVKIESRATRGGPKPAPFYQCRHCKVAFSGKSDLISHALRAHLDQFIKVEEIVGEPPAGNFVVVARCRLSGELLGPPNYHGYNEKVQELHRRRFSHMTLDEYRQHIETIRDPALIERWKDESRKQVVFRKIGEESAPPLSREEAEKLFLEQHADSFISETARAIIPAAAAQQIEDPGIKRTLREIWERESRHPFSLVFALRPAFNHMRLSLFKTSGGMMFVSAIRPAPINPRQAVEPIAGVLRFLQTHPGCTRQQLVEQLCPGAAPDSPEVAAVISPLRWLTDKGHVIEFFDGTLSVPAGSVSRDA